MNWRGEVHVCSNQQNWQCQEDCNIEIEPIPDDSVGKYRAEGVEWAI